MTKYDLRLVGRMVWCAAYMLGQLAIALFMAHERHARGEDDMSAESMERAEALLASMGREFERCGGRFVE